MWVVVQPYIVAFGEKGWGPLHFGLGAWSPKGGKNMQSNCSSKYKNHHLHFVVLLKQEDVKVSIFGKIFLHF